MSDLFKYNGFKLVRLELIKNSFLGTISYDFIETVEDEKNIYTTVIIGPNGTGKSNLFRTIIELFRELYHMKNSGNRLFQVKGLFRMSFALNGDVYTYSNIEDERYKPINYKKGANNAYLLKNDGLINFNEALFPLAIVANSLTITDKYPVYTKEDVFPQYKYLGVRNTPQNASTRSYVRKTVDFIIDNQDSVAFKTGLRNATKFLGVNEAIEIFYSSINGYTFFSGELTPKIFIDCFEKIEEKYKGKEYPPQKLNYYRRISKSTDKIEQLVHFCNLIQNEKHIVWQQGSTVGRIVYNLISKQSYAALKEHGSLLNELRQLGIISPPEISLNKGDSYSLQESSSGEYHLFSSIVGLMATAKINSLIFLDEPESSLHPNWQMKYLSFIRELFYSEEYGTSHIIVATHSHYLISDLKGDSSKIIGLKRAINVEARNGERLEVVDLPYNIDTFGWSAEEVLYKIFDVKTTRNFYLESDLRELLNLISSQSRNTQRMTTILNKVKALRFSENDPINLIIQRADAYLRP